MYTVDTKRVRSSATRHILFATLDQYSGIGHGPLPIAMHRGECDQVTWTLAFLPQIRVEPRSS
jgi:hypothetical protein